MLFRSIKLNLNDLRTWLEFRRTTDTDLDAVDVLMMQSQFVKAQEKLASMQTNLFYTDITDTPEINALASQKLIQIDLFQKKKSIFNLSANQIATLKVMADNNTGRSGAQARGWLNAANGQQYFIPPVFSGIILTKEANNISKNNEQAVGSEILKVFPNPAHEVVNIVVNTDESIKGAVVKIRNAYGEVVKQIAIDSNNLKVTWETQEAAKGIYYISIEQGNKIIEKVQKIIIL